MKNNRFVSIMLTLCVLFCSISLVAYAAEEEKNPTVEAYLPGDYIDAGNLLYKGYYSIVGRQFDIFIKVRGLDSIKEFVFEIEYDDSSVELVSFGLNYVSDNINYMPMDESLIEDSSVKVRIYDDRGIADPGLFSYGYRFSAEEKGNLGFSVRVHSLIDGEGNSYEPEIRINVPEKTYLSTEIPSALPDFEKTLSYGLGVYVKTELCEPMTVGEFTSVMKNAEKCKVEITDYEGRSLSADEYIPTGAKLDVTFDNMPIFSSTFILIGDATRDGKINAADARQVLRFAAGIDSYRDDNVLCNAANTASNTNEITAADAREILRFSAGIGQNYSDWYAYHCVLEKYNKTLINDNL